jgi:thioesterase domain-containing protein/NAD(P)-dependent dehydrogenase (short-subunit alcohol dehydrogenase family)/acyl carrier protein
LGGIGLELAEHLARTKKAKLVLVGRAGLPSRSQWATLMAEGGLAGERLKKVQTIEELGGEVLALSGDVCSIDDMQAIAALTRQRFGALHGVVHSAGIIDDGLISLKTKEAAERVLAVKVEGARVLERVFARVPLDFVVLFSSVSSVLGLEGQIDYTAANAFLDSLAVSNAFHRRTLVVSVGWNAWREIGMAVTLAEQPRAAEFARLGPHPCLERVAVDNAQEVSFVTSFSRSKHWLLSEHVVHGGEALLPGTSYLELARAGLEYQKRDGVVELRDVTFMAPFVAGIGESRELRLRLQRSGPHAGDFSFYGRSETEPCVTGHVEYVDRVPPAALELQAIKQRVSVSEREFHGFLEQHFMDFGPRWANVERIRLGDGEALISLFLPEAFSFDLRAYPLHPALLDMATGGAQTLVPGFDASKDFFVPFAYGRVTIFGPLTSKIHSHVRHRSNGAADIALFDATICDDAGNVLVEIVNFTMRRIARSSALTANAGTRDAAGTSALALTPTPGQSAFGSAVRLGISNAEGMDALERILSAKIRGHVLATSVDINAWLAEVDERTRPSSVTPQSSSAGSVHEGFERPSLSAEFLAPRNDVERELANIWRELLGVSAVGVQDDFFELGGQSLVAVRLFNKIRKRYGVSLPLSTLFEAPNIASCARIIAEELGVPVAIDDSQAAVPLVSAEAPRSSRLVTTAEPSDNAARSERMIASAKKTRWPTLVVMQPQGTPPPFFCAAGLGGTLNNLRKLAIFTGADRPIYGLQPPGADDPSLLLYSVEELAEHYLREVRLVQPHGPYFLGGYSGGGITAFEMCRRLAAEGEKIAFLGLIDSYSPHLPMRSLAERAQIHFKRLSTQGPKSVLDSLGRRLIHERYEATRRVTRGLRQVFPDKFRHEHVQDSWLVAQSRYRPPPWDGKAMLFRARELGSMSLWSAVKDDEQHGWARYLLQGVDVKLCPGDHNSMCEEPNVRVLAAALREALRAAGPPDADEVPRRPSAPPPTQP